MTAAMQCDTVRSLIKHIVFITAVCLTVVSFCSCREKISSLPLTVKTAAPYTVNLIPLDTNARTAHITANGDSMTFAFEAGERLSASIAQGPSALKLTFLRPVPEDELTAASPLSFELSFLARKDSALTAQALHPQAGTVTGGNITARTWTVSFGFCGSDGFPIQDIAGFAVQASGPLIITTAEVVPAQYGWKREHKAEWYGFSAAGGSISPQYNGNIQHLSPLTFPKLALPEGTRAVLTVYTERPPGASDDDRVVLEADGTKLTLTGIPHRSEYTFNTCLFSGIPQELTIEQGADFVCGAVMQVYTPDRFTPLRADTGLILHWPAAAWRNKAYELFAWELFPTILIFDFADYATQDRFFKRLAFFAEKKGFAGTLVSNEVLSGYHGFNAHDYRAETLAAFFSKAAADAFPLNTEELHLQELLLANGIITVGNAGFDAGRGAVVSLSQESVPYLRRLFITHECLHGIYFTEERFRHAVDEVFTAADPKAIAFLRRYFEVTPFLNYNTDDMYLLKNEFMAYMLQQNLAAVPFYFADVISRRKELSYYEPELCAYVRKTRGRPFAEAAAQLNAFLEKTWGIRSGNVSHISLKKKENNIPLQ